jgi:hypothetical protein
MALIRRSCNVLKGRTYSFGLGYRYWRRLVWEVDDIKPLILVLFDISL